MSADNIFCLALIVAFFGIMLKELAVKHDWLMPLLRKALTRKPDHKLLDTWVRFTLVNSSQYDALEKEFGLSPDPEQAAGPISAGTVPVTLTDDQVNQASGQALLTASLPLRARMHRLNELHTRILTLIIEVNRFRSQAGLEPYEVKL